MKQRVGARVKAMNAGRWDVVRPLREPSAEERLNRAFDCQPVLCRETASACGLPWQEALSLLRIWEYTGQARRGYFVEGFSGAQFIRGTEYAGIVRALEHPEEKLVWINAADPAQCWGKLLPHREGRSFINVPGTLVACHAGIPVAVLERQGKTLRVFEDRYLAEGLMLFAEEYRRGKLFRDKKRIEPFFQSIAYACGILPYFFPRSVMDPSASCMEILLRFARIFVRMASIYAFRSICCSSFSFSSSPTPWDLWYSSLILSIIS